MLSLKGIHGYLRALEPEDLNFLYELENNTQIWEISGTTTPYSKHILQLYLDNAHKDIYEAKQLRLCICNSDDNVVGLIDLFDFDPHHHRAGIGIVILEEKDRNKGLGLEALQLLENYAFDGLHLRQLYANVLEDNEASIHLFKKLDYRIVGEKKDWIFQNKKYKDEILFQKINK
ncbi:GNAT family N-acetyltransferase [Sediminicola arcticus]|jgi:diamine N-acetyltransferase|uniref:GNAT family protein n=1 Tax=Sediminicola arcticus TaxID=1574308 RepID=A0ABV2ST50_9FLAO